MYPVINQTMRHFIIILTIIFSIKQSTAQFIGKSGVYFLGSADIPVPAAKYSNPNISGVVCRFRWETLELSPNNFNWNFIDGEILKARNANKKISLQPLGYPAWIIDSLNAQPYYYIDKNQQHPTFGQVVLGVLPWDSIYIIRVKNLIQHLASKYSNDTTVSYLNLIGGQISRNLPDTVLTDTTLLIKQPFWTAFNYNADTLAVLMDTMIDYYMNVFPNTPLWCSVDYVRFEYNASSHPVNYLATLYINYGITNYPDRFGLFREDISGCTPYSTVNTGSQWFIMKNNPCRTGAQMLWSVQDGPARMNMCGITPNTKQVVLDSAVNNGIAFGMRYIEIYGADIDDASLTANIAAANTNLINKGNLCNVTTSIVQLSSGEGLKISIYPNPTNNTLFIKTENNNSLQYQITNSIGQLIKHENLKGNRIDVSSLRKGLYFIQLKDAKGQYLTSKFIKE